MRVIVGIVVLAILAGAVGFFGEFIQPKESPSETEEHQENGVEEVPMGGEKHEACIQVITPARDPETGTIVEFPTPCDVPDGWEFIQNDIPELGFEPQPI